MLVVYLYLKKIFYYFHSHIVHFAQFIIQTNKCIYIYIYIYTYISQALLHVPMHLLRVQGVITF